MTAFTPGPGTAVYDGLGVQRVSGMGFGRSTASRFSVASRAAQRPHTSDGGRPPGSPRARRPLGSPRAVTPPSREECAPAALSANAAVTVEKDSPPPHAHRSELEELTDSLAKQYWTVGDGPLHRPKSSERGLLYGFGDSKKKQDCFLRKGSPAASRNSNALETQPAMISTAKRFTPEMWRSVSSDTRRSASFLPELLSLKVRDAKYDQRRHFPETTLFKSHKTRPRDETYVVHSLLSLVSPQDRDARDRLARSEVQPGGAADGGSALERGLHER